jgi:large subunit ribosomal protein L13
MKTFFANAQNAKRDWVVIDAEGQTLGRLASEIARRLRGKHKPEFTPHADVGDYVVVINAEKVRVTGKKMQDKLYWRHTGYPGGIKSTNLSDLLAKHPERVVEKAVKGMLPRGPLGYAQYGKLKVYAGTEHPHTAQQPAAVTL